MTIHADQTLGPLNQKVFGAAIYWKQRGDYLWHHENTQDHLNHAVVAKANRLGIPLLRLHSGAMVWKLHTGPQSERNSATPSPIERYPDPKGYGPRNYGPLEFMKSCEALHAEPILVVNVATDYAHKTKDNGGLAQDAADLLEYLNGVVTPALKAQAKAGRWQTHWYKGAPDAAGHYDYAPVAKLAPGYYAWLRWQHLGARDGLGEDGYRIQYWEIGNEIYFGYMQPWATSDPIGFATVLNAFARKLKQREALLIAHSLYPANLHIECGAPTPTWEGRNRDWMGRAFQLISSDIDFVIPHIYYAPPNRGCSNWRGIRTRVWDKSQSKECLPVFLESGHKYLFQLQLICKNWDVRVEIKEARPQAAWRAIYNARGVTSNWDARRFEYSPATSGPHRIKVAATKGSRGASSELQARMFRFRRQDKDWSWPYFCADYPDNGPYRWSNDPQLIKFNPTMDIAKCYFAAPEKCVRDQIRWLRSKVGDRRLLVTEFNTCFDVEAVDMKSAIFIADVLRVFMEERIEGATFWHLADYCHNRWFSLIDSGQGADRFNKDRGWQLDRSAHLAKERPNFLLYAMLNQYFRRGAHLVKTEVENSPSFSMPDDDNPDTPAPAWWRGSWPQLTAVASRGPGRLYILAINKGDSLDTWISVRGRTVTTGVKHVLHTDPRCAAVQNGGMAVEATNENYYARTIRQPNVVITRSRLEPTNPLRHAFEPYSVTILELGTR